MRFGIHVSIAGGLHLGLKRAVEIGCESVQIFLVNPRSWRTTPLTDEVIDRFHSVRQTDAKKIMPLVAHLPYLPNLAALDGDIFDKSVLALRDHLHRCDALQIDFLVIHIGKSRSRDGVARMIDGIERAYGDYQADVSLLLENTAGQGSEMGSQVTELAEIYERIPKGIPKGICLDTCHAFAAGYNVAEREGIKKLIGEFDQTIGFKEVKLLHINDSLRPLGSRVDRHAKIGEGHIGKKGFKVFFSNRSIKRLPCILEVPRKTDEDDIKQLKLVRSLAPGKRK